MLGNDEVIRYPRARGIGSGAYRLFESECLLPRSPGGTTPSAGFSVGSRTGSWGRGMAEQVSDGAVKTATDELREVSVQ